MQQVHSETNISLQTGITLNVDSPLNTYVPKSHLPISPVATVDNPPTAANVLESKVLGLHCSADRPQSSTGLELDNPQDCSSSSESSVSSISHCCHFLQGCACYESSVLSQYGSASSRKRSCWSRESSLSHEDSLLSRDGFCWSRKDSLSHQGLPLSHRGSPLSRNGSYWSREGTLSREGSRLSCDGSCWSREGSLSHQGSLTSREDSCWSREGCLLRQGSPLSLEGSCWSHEGYSLTCEGFIAPHGDSSLSREYCCSAREEPTYSCIARSLSREDFTLTCDGPYLSRNRVGQLCRGDSLSRLSCHLSVPSLVSPVFDRDLPELSLSKPQAPGRLSHPESGLPVLGHPVPDQPLWCLPHSSLNRR